MSKRACFFDEDWKRLHYENNISYIDKFDVWLVKGKIKNEGFCKLCNRSIDVSAMGRSANFCHAKGNKHQTKFKNVQKIQTITLYNKVSSNEDNSTSASSTSNASSPISSYIINKDATEAEMLWVLRTVLCHNSSLSCDGIPKLFMRMFSDSSIAKAFTMGRTKCSYFINFGIASYFKEVLQQKMKATPFFALSYNESLNRIFQEEQMDIKLRYFNAESGELLKLVILTLNFSNDLIVLIYMIACSNH